VNVLILIVCAMSESGELCMEFEMQRGMKPEVCQIVRGMETRRVSDNLKERKISARVFGLCAEAKGAKDEYPH